MMIQLHVCLLSAYVSSLADIQIYFVHYQMIK